MQDCEPIAHNVPSSDQMWMSPWPKPRRTPSTRMSSRYHSLGTVFTTFQGTAEPVIRETLNIPDDVHIGCLIPVGWPDANFGPLKRVGYDKVVHMDGWQGDLRTYPPTYDD